MSPRRHLAPVPAPTPAPTPALVVHMTGEQLAELVRDAVRAELERRERDAGPASEWLDAEQAAGIVKVHPRTIRNLATNGALPGTRVGKQWRFRRADLDAYLLRMRVDRSGT